MKKAYGRSLFAEPQPFKDEGRGGVIVASAKGKVEVVAQKRNRYSDKDPDPRAVIVGESVGPGTTLITGSGSSADLLLTNGTLAHLGENTKLVLTALYQKAFKGNKVKASELEKEVSPSRTALKLEEGDLVLEVRKLGKESSFLVETKIAQAGIRGTQFKVSASADSLSLSVLEGGLTFWMRINGYSCRDCQEGRHPQGCACQVGGYECFGAGGGEASSGAELRVLLLRSI